VGREKFGQPTLSIRRPFLKRRSRRDLPPAVDPAQLDLPTHHAAEEQDPFPEFSDGSEPRAFLRRRHKSWSSTPMKVRANRGFCEQV